MPTAIRALVSLGAGRQQLVLIEAARAAGLAVIAVDRDPRAPGHALATQALAFEAGRWDEKASCLVGVP